MEAAIEAIFSFGPNEMKEVAKKSIGSFLTQTQICSKPRNGAIGFTPNLDLLLIRTKKRKGKKKKKTIQIWVGVCVQLIFVEEFVYKFWNILGFYSFVLGIEYSGFVVLVCL